MTWGEDVAWLAGVQAGDVVFISTRNGLSRDKVTSVTPTQVRVGQYIKFRKRDGREIAGDPWNFRQLLPSSPELERQYETARARVSLREMQWSQLSDEAVMEVYELVKRHHPKTKP